MLLDAANYVEIDLLRGGQRMPMIDPWPNAPYTILVSRKGSAARCKVWSAHYRKPLPLIAVPLASPDPDVTLDLQPLIQSIYMRSKYGRSIDYAKPLVPPLPPEDVAWLRERLAK
jgi:hypothetical protein